MAEIETEESTARLAFEISREEIGSLFADRSRLMPNAHSPFAGDLKTYARGAVPPTDNVNEIAADAHFDAVAGILLRPDWRMSHRIGGGSSAISGMMAFRSAGVKQDAIVTVEPSSDTSVVIQYFEDYQDYLTSWINTFASLSEVPTEDYLPAPVSVESLIYILHSIDAYRIAAYQSQISYTPAQIPFIKAEAFVETLSKSLESRDIRWLLPAFVLLTPGMEDYTLQIAEEDYRLLTELNFLRGAEHPETKEKVFFFGDAAREMGIEFYRSWMYAVGFGISALSEAKETEFVSGFLAPTSLTNHLILLDRDASKSLRARYETYSGEGLISAFETILHQTLFDAERILSEDDELEELEAAETVSEAPAPEVLCPSCRSPVPEGSRFCPHCGSDLLPERPQRAASEPAQEAITCASCEATLSLGQKFCGKCGTPVAAEPSQEAAPGPSQEAAVCASCGGVLSPGQKFCSKCGAKAGPAAQPRELLCANCGRQLAPGAAFCTGCGKPVR